MIIINPKIDLERFFHDLSKSKAALLLLDYDGTLAPFSQNPEDAHPYPGVSEKITRIMLAGHTKVVILSGRDLKGLKALLKISPLPEIWGSHGGERLQANAETPIVKKLDLAVKNLLTQASSEAKLLAPQLYHESKPLSIALHWRDKDVKIAQEQSSHVLKRWQELIFGHPLEIHEFDGGIELRPLGINKGEAVKILLQEISPDTMIAYLGDDFTDEEAFKVLGSRALKVLVRKVIRPTRADIHLVAPSDLLWFLDQWIQSQTRSHS